MTERNGLERRQAIIDLLDLPDDPDLHRGNRLTLEGRPDRYRLVPYFVSAFVQARLLDFTNGGPAGFMPRPKQQSKPSLDVDAVCRQIVQRLSDARADQDISIASLARVLGRTPERLERLESARVPLTLPILIEWARALGLDLVTPAGEKRPADPASPPLFRPALRRGRPMAAPPRPLPLLSQEQIAQLRCTPVPHTGNKLLTALKLSDATMVDLARAANLRYVRIANWVGGRVKTVPSPYADHLAMCFGCKPQDLFPEASRDDAGI